MPVELELESLRLTFQAEELNSTDIPRRFNALLVLEEQRSFVLNDSKKRQHTVKNYVDKKEKVVTSEASQKVLLRDSSHAVKGIIRSFKNYGWVHMVLP